MLEISASEARRLASDIATASQASSNTEVSEKPAPEEPVSKEQVSQATPQVNESAVRETVSGTAARYPELESLREKVEELQRLLEERSIKGEN